MVCLSVIVKPRKWKRPWPTRGCGAIKNVHRKGNLVSQVSFLKFSSTDGNVINKNSFKGLAITVFEIKICQFQ